MASQTETAPKEAPDVKIGSIFKYLGGPLVKNAEHNLLASLSCYEEARRHWVDFHLVLQNYNLYSKRKGGSATN